ncbi:hypothetical protein P691DRAFT_67194 [Macrolepiota fuliginosa MF-IS2]|uniref:Uncharacterized protein n=1 Tax=Macrolepiota fuliginosa MF-IS2 TaxID=1400762 RepID=A0A9P5X0R6_9AGAR|nr:hypothetical protein P691DRAFT_67194 [Macrolepiota fuliginosa MF-IS2]
MLLPTQTSTRSLPSSPQASLVPHTHHTRPYETTRFHAIDTAVGPTLYLTCMTSCPLDWIRAKTPSYVLVEDSKARWTETVPSPPPPLVVYFFIGSTASAPPLQRRNYPAVTPPGGYASITWHFYLTV